MDKWLHVKIVIVIEYCNRNLYVKKGNIYSVNTVNIENTVSTVNTANNKNNILTSLTLPMDCSLLVESTLQIDFENTQDEDLDKTSRKGYVYIPNATSLIYLIFLITTTMIKINIVAAQKRKVTLELMKRRLIRRL